tara:strand:+ start:153 stop:257 length:105 start_codon:yes stop_codon:yes gene_type:complete
LIEYFKEFLRKAQNIKSLKKRQSILGKKYVQKAL